MNHLSNTASQRTYRVKEIFGPTVQGEGLHAGWPCVFVRLSGCNAWDGRPENRANSACPYCDTDFFGGDSLDTASILRQLLALHAAIPLSPTSQQALHNMGCVLTGGEPLLQADAHLINALADVFEWVDIETNGTRAVPEGLADNVYISCSPKNISNQPIIATPHWWKILIPAQEAFLKMALESNKPIYLNRFVQTLVPQGHIYQQNVDRCTSLAYQHNCRISLQLHKFLGLP